MRVHDVRFVAGPRRKALVVQNEVESGGYSQVRLAVPKPKLAFLKSAAAQTGNVTGLFRRDRERAQIRLESADIADQFVSIDRIWHRAYLMSGGGTRSTTHRDRASRLFGVGGPETAH
jgi:hypothetical protein